MAYIGKQPLVGNYTVLDAITATTTDTYALTKNSVAVFPQTPANCIVSLNGVIQAPTDSYTISGSNIVFASALTGSDSIDFITVLGDVLNVGTVSDGTIGLAKLSATGTKDATTFLRGDNTFAEVPAGGITVADQWRLTSNLSLSTGVTTDVTSNLEQVDTAGQGTIGTAMSESSGVFTFPETGVYLVNFYVTGNINADTRYIFAKINVTINNSTYTEISNNGMFLQQSSGSDSLSNSITQTLVDVTDTANVKVKFSILSANNATAIGNSTYNRTHMTFIRLGDT